MTPQNQKAALKLEDLERIREFLSEDRSNSYSKGIRVRKIEKLSTEVGISARRIRDLLQKPEYLNERIESARNKAIRFRVFLEFERLLCWPMDRYIKTFKPDRLTLGVRQDDRTSTYKNHIYGLFAYGMDLSLRQYRGNDFVKARARESLKKWSDGDIAVHCTPIKWKQSVKHTGKKRSILVEKLRRLLLVADRASPQEKFLFSIMPEDILEENAAVNYLISMIERSSLKVVKLSITATYINGQSVPTLSGKDVLSKHYSDIRDDPPTLSEGPIIFKDVFSCEEDVLREIAKTVRKFSATPTGHSAMVDNSQ